MKRAIRSIICVFAICSMITVVGCGDKKDGAKKDTTKSSETSKADEGAAEKK